MLSYPTCIPAKISGCSLGVDRLRDVTVCKEKKAYANQPWDYFRSIQTYMAMIPQRHRQTERQIDRWMKSMNCRSNTALCVESRGEKKRKGVYKL